MSQVSLRLTWGHLVTHVEYDEEDDVKPVENNKNPEQPPGCRIWEQQGEAASWMIQQELEFFPNSTLIRHKF